MSEKNDTTVNLVLKVKGRMEGSRKEKIWLYHSSRLTSGIKTSNTIIFEFEECMNERMYYF